ncbi:MAG TPA: hypothetical protein DIW47_13375 [Bacteroidetes bacterium]|nr:hypothetical protein [Bacteroidota bacterium]
MKFPIRLFLILFAFALSSQLHLQAQSESDSTRQKVVVVMNDGTERVGYILSDDGREILLETQALGKIYILKSSIARITPIKDGEVVETVTDDHDYRSAGPFTTRYHFTTNALPIKKNENYAMLNLFGPEVHFAVTDRLSLGVMSTWIASPLALAVKYSIPTKNKKLNFGLGTIMGTSGYFNSFQGFGGLHWGMVSVGDRIRNITFSAGYGYISPRMTLVRAEKTGTYDAVQVQGNWTAPEIPYEDQYRTFAGAAFGLGGVFPVGKKASVILDGMLFIGERTSQETTRTDVSSGGQLDQVVVSEDPAVQTTIFYLMPGMRFQQTATTAFQFALAGVSVYQPGETFSFPVPTCSWLRKF